MNKTRKEPRKFLRKQYDMNKSSKNYDYWNTLSLTNQFYFNTGDINLETISEDFFNIENVKKNCSFSIEFIKKDFSEGINVEYFTVPNVYYKQDTSHKFIYFELPKTKVIEIRFVKDKLLESLKENLETKEKEIEKLKQTFETSPSEIVSQQIMQKNLQNNPDYKKLNLEKEILSSQIKKYKNETKQVDEIQKAAHLYIYKTKIIQLINNCNPLYKLFGYKKKNIKFDFLKDYSIQFEIKKRECTQYNNCFDLNFRNNFNIHVYFLNDSVISYFVLTDFKIEYLKNSIRFYELYNKLIESKNEIIKKDYQNVYSSKNKLPDITRASFSLENITS